MSWAKSSCLRALMMIIKKFLKDNNNNNNNKSNIYKASLSITSWTQSANERDHQLHLTIMRLWPLCHHPAWPWCQSISLGSRTFFKDKGRLCVRRSLHLSYLWYLTWEIHGKNLIRQSKGNNLGERKSLHLWLVLSPDMNCGGMNKWSKSWLKGERESWKLRLWAKRSIKKSLLSQTT